MATRKTSGKSKRPVARGKGGRPPRQRHAQAHAAHRAKAAKSGATKSGQKWSHHVMETSDAMDIEHNIFKTGSPQSIAESLKRSSTQSRRRKGTPFQSAMSMLNFYINRAGKNLPEKRLHLLEKAKSELRKLYGKEAARSAGCESLSFQRDGGGSLGRTWPTGSDPATKRPAAWGAWRAKTPVPKLFIGANPGASVAQSPPFTPSHGPCPRRLSQGSSAGRVCPWRAIR
jgi:hypothetical protein